MREKKSRPLKVLVFLAGLLCWPAAASAQFHPKDTEWPSYAADLAGTRYRPLDQINAANFNDLEIAWRIKTDNFGNRRSEEHTSELQSRQYLVCRLLLEKKKTYDAATRRPH